METFLYMDHTREDCVTALPNLVTGDFREKKSHIWSAVTRRNCLRMFLIKKKRNHEKDLQLFEGEIRYCLQKETFFEL